MNQGLLQWRSHCLLSSSIPLSSIPRSRLIISANNAQQQQQEQELSAREKRQLRNERRASNSTNWREQVEERLIKKPKKRFATWTEELNLDTLAKLGPQWWVVRVGRIRTVDTAEVLARLLARNFPEIDFQVCLTFYYALKLNSHFRFTGFLEMHLKPADGSRLIISANNAQQQQQEQELSAREKRQLRNERRASNSTNWREQVEERLIKKPKKRFATWTEELNLDTLAKLGPQWWVVRVGRIRTVDTAELLARLLARNFPEIDFQVYTAAVNVKRKLKNGTCSVKPKPQFPGCVFLRCVLNREIHDFIRECEGVGGFVGSKVGNTKKQINKPRPVSDVDMEAIFKQAKEEQQKTDRAFEEEQKEENLNSRMLSVDTHLDPNDDTQSVTESKSRRVSKKASDSIRNGSSTAKKYKLLVPGSTVRVVSGTFAEFVGSLKKVNRKTGKATVGFTLFGKESLVDLDVNDVVAETN
nr:transcription termination/antitermination protein nusg [Quercus suber]